MAKFLLHDRELVFSCLCLIPVIKHTCPNLLVTYMYFSILKDKANKFGNTQGFKYI
jgi:hypothetical protein